MGGFGKNPGQDYISNDLAARKAARKRLAALPFEQQWFRARLSRLALSRRASQYASPTLPRLTGGHGQPAAL